MKDLLLIMNDITGNGRNAPQTFRIIKYMADHGYKTTVFPIAEGTSPDLAEYLKDSSFDKVVCMGGDGTLSTAINEIMKLPVRPTIGYIPAGTTNDFAKNLNLTSNVDRALETIVADQVINYDLGVFNDRYFNYVAFFGAFADISYNTDQKFKNVFGYAAYFISGISTINENLHAKCHVRFETDRESFEGDYLFGAICNSMSVAGIRLAGITMDELHDGEFELFLIKCPETAQQLGEIALALLNSNYDSPYIEYKKVRHAEIMTSTNTEWTLDGEYGGNPEKVTFNIIPGALRLLI